MKDVEEGECENADTHRQTNKMMMSKGEKGEKGGKGEVMCSASDLGVCV